MKSILNHFQLLFFSTTLSSNMSSKSVSASDDDETNRMNCAKNLMFTKECYNGDKCRNPDTCGFYHNESDRRDISKMKPCGNCRFCNRPTFVKFLLGAQNTPPHYSGSKPSHHDSKNADLYKTIAEQTMEIQRLKTENERLKNLLKNKKQ